MKKSIFLIFCIIFSSSLIAQQSVSISGQSIVEVGIPYNYTFQFMPVYPTNTTTNVTADSYVITEWIVSTGTNSDGYNPNGFIGTTSNQSSYYYNGTYPGSNPLTVPIQWGSGGNITLNYDTITVKVSGIYKKSSTDENVGYFQFLTNTKSVTIERLNAPIIAGPSPIASCNQTNQTYSFSNATNSNSRLWSVTNGGTIVGSNTGTSVVVKPPLVGNFTVNCQVNRTGANTNYNKIGSKTVTRNPYLSSSSISGTNFICTSGTYSITGLVAGESVLSWSVSNSSIATISNTAGSSTTVNKVSDGLVTLSATITNSCAETSIITKDIVIGKPLIDIYAVQGGYDNVPVGSNSILNVIAANSGITYSWSILQYGTNSCGSSYLPSIVSNGPQTSKRINWGNCTGYYRVRCSVSNGCALNYYSDKLVRVFDSSNNPCPPARMGIKKNPISIGDEVVLNIVDEPNLPPCNNSEFRTINSVKVYDLNGIELFTKKINNEKEIQLNNLNLKTGIYIVKLFLENGESLTEKLIVN